MNEQEREVIGDIFRRIEQVADRPRDPEAERFIEEKLRRQPYAPYAMAQAIFVQEQALGALQSENEQLRAELEELRRRPPQGGFLSGLFGAGPRPQGSSHGYGHQRQASPWGRPAPQPFAGPHGTMGAAPGPWGGAMQQRGGFLQGALSTAAGVAGGVMIANALSHAFGGGEAQSPSGDTAALADTQGPADNAGITDSLYQGGQDDHSDFGGDSGGDGGDWA